MADEDDEQLNDEDLNEVGDDEEGEEGEEAEAEEEEGSGGKKKSAFAVGGEEEGEEEEEVEEDSDEIVDRWGEGTSLTDPEVTMASYKDTRDVQEQGRLQVDGDAIVGAWMKQGRVKGTPEEDAFYKRLMGEMEKEEERAKTLGKPKYLVNPLTFGHGELDYADEFGDDAGEPGLRVWRISKWETAAIPENKIGQFHTQDCYLIVWTSDKDRSKVTNIHVWIGSDSTSDKWGTATIKSLELNHLIGGVGIMHREVQGEESVAFKKYFEDRGVIEYIEGGQKTGFRRPAPFAHVPRLYQCVPDKEVKLKLIKLGFDALSTDAAFVLDAGAKIFAWYGSETKKLHRFRTLALAKRILSEERSGKGRVIEIEQSEDENAEGDEADFWEILTSKMEDEEEEEEGGEEGEKKEEPEPEIKLLRLEGQSSLQKVTERPLKRSMLDTNHVFILDVGSEIFVWYGRKAPDIERKVSLALVKRLSGQPRPKYFRSKDLYEGAEIVSFKAKFSDWWPHSFETYSKHTVDEGAPIKLWAEGTKQDQLRRLVSNQSSPPSEDMVDDGRSEIQMWNIEAIGPKFIRLPRDERGNFYSNDCYLVLYTYYDYSDGKKQKYLAYFWEGSNSSPVWYPSFLFGFLPAMRKKLGYRAKGDRFRYFRIQEHKEPLHFMKIFGGRIIVHKGSRRTMCRLIADKSAILDVRKAEDFRTYAVEVAKSSTSLHSLGSFVLLYPPKVYLWNGTNSTPDDREEASIVSEKFSKIFKAIKGSSENITFDEEEEQPEFWSLLGGEFKFADQGFIKKYVNKPPRLFALSVKTGELEITEHFRFSRLDFVEEQTFILDTHWEVFLWLGKRSFDTLRTASTEAANHYIRFAAVERRQYIPLVVVESGKEPNEFKWMFHAWNPIYEYPKPEEAGRVEFDKQVYDKYKSSESKANQAAYQEQDEREKEKLLTNVRQIVSETKKTVASITETKKKAEHDLLDDKYYNRTKSETDNDYDDVGDVKVDDDD